MRLFKWIFCFQDLIAFGVYEAIYFHCQIIDVDKWVTSALLVWSLPSCKHWTGFGGIAEVETAFVAGTREDSSQLGVHDTNSVIITQIILKWVKSLNGKK